MLFDFLGSYPYYGHKILTYSVTRDCVFLLEGDRSACFVPCMGNKRYDCGGHEGK